MDSIQEWLTSQGFEIDQDKEVFRKGSNEVPFSDLGYYSLESLKTRLKDKGWVTDKPTSEDDMVPTPYGGWIVWPYGVDFSDQYKTITVTIPGSGSIVRNCKVLT